MRFNILVASSFLVTLAAGLVIPANTLSSRDLEIREGLVEDNVNILLREPIYKEYKVPAGNGEPARTYTKQDFKSTVEAANEWNSRPKNVQKTAGLQPYQNKGAFLTNKKLMEFPILSKSGEPDPNGNLILKEKNGKLEFKGVVAQKQNGFNRIIPSLRGGKAEKP